jgi:hypothetical protein
MSALSQSLIFIPAQSVNASGTVSITYPNTATNTLVYHSDKVKGDGYYGASDGLHTAMYTANPTFLGTVTMQATLSISPVEGDWFNVTGTTTSYNKFDIRTTTTVDYCNFTGNFVWVRGQVSISQGSIDSIQYNH